MDWFIENWYIVFGFTAMVICAVFGVLGFIKQPREKQIQALKEWLKYAVAVAEKELGSGTGQLKLRYVYNLAVARFYWIEKVLTFEQFSAYVDEALEWLQDQLVSNKDIKALVKG